MAMLILLLVLKVIIGVVDGREEAASPLSFCAIIEVAKIGRLLNDCGKG